MSPSPASLSLPGWVAHHARRAPDAPAVAGPTQELTYGELAHVVRRLAASLSDDGAVPGERILVALPNVIAAVVAGLAVQSVGAIVVEANREWGPEALSSVITQAGVQRAVVWGRDAKLWAGLRQIASLRHLWVVHPEPSAVLSAALGPGHATVVREDGYLHNDTGATVPWPPPEPDPNAASLVLYTSGSTGTPRGVLQSHANVDANSRSIVEYLELGPEDRALLVLPLSYCYGRSVLHTHLLAGGSVFLETRTAFPRQVLDSLAQERCTGFAGVPLTFEVLRRQSDPRQFALHRLRYLTQAGGPMAPETADWVRQVFAPASLFIMYGQTEATARLSYLPPARARDKSGSIGVAIPGVHLAVVDEAACPVPTGVVGHLVAQGANVTAGYLDDPAETAAILHDGWLWTGDLARCDTEGFFFLEGRAKEILKVSGHRVGPTEIEAVLARHRDVAEAAVIGRPDPLTGERILAFVVLNHEVVFSEDDLRRFCRSQLPAFKVPSEVRAISRLPRNEAGKLLRARLAADADIANRSLESTAKPATQR